MPFLQQLIQFLSQPPGSLVYHLVTLLALQAALGIAWWQARNRPADGVARRLAWAAAGILTARLVFFLAVLLTGQEAITAATWLPPLEQAINTVTAVLLVWALSPHVPRLPRLGDVILLLVVLFIGVMYAFFANDWAAQIAEGAAFGGYQASDQATIWSVFQLITLTLGLGLILIGRPPDWALRLSLTAVLLATHLVHALQWPAILATETETAYWIRLGHLIALPLLAALAYRHTLGQLMLAQMIYRPPAEQLADALHLSGQVIENLDINRTLYMAVAMVAEVVDAEFVALATPSLDDPDHLRLTSAAGTEKKGQGSGGRPGQWRLKLSDWPAFRMAMQQRQGVELLANGLGARQLHDLYQEMGIGALGSLLVEPLLVNGKELGVLLLAGPVERERWPAQVRALTPFLARFIGRALANAQQYEQALRELSPLPLLAETQAQGRLAALEEQIVRMEQEAADLTNQLRLAEENAASQYQRAKDLAAVIAELDGASEDERVVALEREMATLRESLVEAEEAMAMASAGEGGLSTEWVMLTITRYSSELEEAQARIHSLEAKLRETDGMEDSSLLVSLVEELRTPLASISGYTDLLLTETMGLLGVKQLGLLRRVKANIEHIATLLEQIVQLTAGDRSFLSMTETIDAREAIESAVNGIMAEVREKELRLDLNLTEGMPALRTNRDNLYQLIMGVFNHACAQATAGGYLDIQADTVQGTEEGSEGFFHLAVSSVPGGRPTLPSNNGHRNGQVETATALAAVRTLAAAGGGRVWVDNQGNRHTVSVLLPVSGQAANVPA
jgi:GAF domain-containing protein